ncbi:3-ketoacyl-CoA thiolase 2, peroxisomal-like protein [Tanacetum coccineum]
MKQGEHSYVEAAIMAISTCLREPVGENSCAEVVPYRWLQKAKETKAILRIEELLSVLMENEERKTKNLSVTFDDVDSVDATKAELIEIGRFGRNVKIEVLVVTGPVVAIPCTKKSAGLRVDDIDLFEINEAFAYEFGNLYIALRSYGVILEK